MVVDIEKLINQIKGYEKNAMKMKYNYFRIIIFLIIGITSSSLHSQFVSLELFDTDAGELGGNPGSFRVSLSSTRGVDTQVGVLVDASVSTAISGTSAANGDRTAINGTFTIPANQFSVIISVDVFDDGLVEGDEIIKLDLISSSGPTSINPFSASATLVIKDNDFALLDVGDVQATEGNNLVFNIRTDKPVEYSHIVTVDFSGGTATKGGAGLVYPDDYNGNQRTITFLPGEVTKQMAVITGNDIIVENDETFIVTLTSDTNSNVTAGDTGTGTIENNDVGNITIEDVTETEGDNMRFRVINNLEVPNAFSVTVNFLDLTATGGDVDYDSAQQILNFSGAAGQGRNVDVDTADDNFIEGTETFTVTLLSSDALVEDSDTATGFIEDDDVFRATITATDGTAIEANPVTNTGTFTVSLDEVNTTGAPVIVNYTVSGSAAEGSDYTTLSGSVSIANNQQSNTILITPLNDNAVENAETVILELAAGISYDLGSAASRTATITINDTDTFTASVVATGATANENPTTNGTFTINLGAVNSTGSAVIVNYNLTGTAIVGADFNSIGNSVSIGNGQSTGVVTIIPINDSDVEVNETVVLNLAAGTNYSIGSPNNASVTIVSDDVNVARITASDATAAESNGAAATGEFTISLSAPNNTGSIMTINYVVSGSAVNGTDYTAISANAINIPPGGQSEQVLISPSNDQIQEGSETVIITLGTGTSYALGAAATRTATVQINDNDQATLEVFGVTENEDLASGQFVFNVVLDIAVVGGTQVSYSFFDDTATGGGIDYTGTPGTLIFTGTANETMTITVPINNDAVLENTEAFEVQLGLPTNNVQLVNSGTAIGTINDDDNCVAAPVLDASVSPIYCVVDTGSAFSANLFDFTTSIAPSGTVLTWSRVSNPLTTTSHLTPAEAQDVSTPASYYGFFYDAANNCASGTIEVQIVRNITPEILSITGNERCGPGTLLLSVTPSDGASVNWYDSLDAVTPIAFGETYTTPSLNATATYYVEATENECTTERQPVIARIGFQATTGTAQNGAICNVTANGLTSIDLDTRLTGADPGVWVFVSGPEDDINLSSTNVVDFEGLTSGAYIFRFTTTNSTAPCVNPTVEVIINVSDCESDDDNDGLLGGQEVALGLDPNNPDTDGDGIEDGVEVGPDIANPLDEDSDGIIDALDSNTEDTDNDGVNDQQDPANNNPCIPNRFNGFCDTDGDGLSDLDEQTNGSDPDDPCDPVATPNCDDPIDLEVLKSVDNEDAQIGDTVVFEITVTNLSDRTARAIVVGDLLELGFDFVSKSSLDYDEVSGMWNIAELEAGLSTVLTITVTVSEEGPYENTATLLESIPSDGNTANDESTVTLNTEVPEGVDLLVEKEARPNKVLVGDEVEFIIKVTNISQTDVVTDIILNDFILVENGFEFVSAESDFNGVYDASTGNWTIPSLNLDETATLRIMARVPQTGVFNNTVNLVRSSPRDGNPLNDEATVEVEVIEKSQADPGFLYNQFSPNGNNQNEILRINRTDPVTRLEVTLQYNIKIYDRYGNLVFETEKVNDGDVWDGTYKGKEVPRGTYFYIMNYSINNEPAILDKGWIQLIR